MAHRSRLAGFIIDCHNTPADEAAAFWSAALGYRAQPAYSEEGAEYADLAGAPAGLNVEVQRVDHASRMHLDIESDDIDAAMRSNVPACRNPWIFTRILTAIASSVRIAADQHRLPIGFHRR